MAEKFDRDLSDNLTEFNSLNKSLPNITTKEMFEDVKPTIQKPVIETKKVVVTKTQLNFEIDWIEYVIIILLFILLNMKFIINMIYGIDVFELNPHQNFNSNLIIRTIVFIFMIFGIKQIRNYLNH